MLLIKPITREGDELTLIKELFKEYSIELDENLGFQSFEEELENPLKKYCFPLGSLFLACHDSQPAGCIAMKPLEEGICEMKRLYVRPQYRKHGIAGELVESLVTDAKDKGYKKMVLDTLFRLEPAIKLYLRHGFTYTSPYYKNPLTNVVYMEKRLND